MSEQLRALTDADAPTIWPACSECGAAWAYQRALTMTGYKWVWAADCKHPRNAKFPPVMMTADGPYAP